MNEPSPRQRRQLDGPARRSAHVPHPDARPVPPIEVTAQEVDAPAPPQHREPIFEYQKPVPPRRKWLKVARWVAVALLIMGVGAGAWLGYRSWDAFRKIVGNSNGGAPGLHTSDLDVTKLKGEGDGRVNILLLGVGGPGHEGPTLSDSIMVISIDPKAKDVAMLSIPRDLYVKIPGNGYGKINAANVYGGPVLAEKVVSTVIGVPIHYYLQVDFSGFKQAVDAVGGIDINVPKAIYDPEYPCDNAPSKVCAFSVKAGPQQMNGTVALRYARSRKTTSDFDRAMRQQLVLAALREKALKVSTLTNPVKLASLIDAIGSHVKTDLQPDEITKLASLAKDIDIANATQKVLDTSPDSVLIDGTGLIAGAGSIELPRAGNFDYSEIHDLVKNIFVDRYITAENALIEVQNGSGVVGRAAAVVKSLKAAHYNVGDAVNADANYAKTVIYDYTGGKKPYTINYLERRFGVKAQKQTAPTPGTNASGQQVPAPQIRIILGSDSTTPTFTP